MGAVTDTVRDTFAQVGGAFGIGDKGTPNVSGYAPTAQENDFTNALLARYNGTSAQPSAAELQMNQGLDQANANASAFAASQRGISPALAARLAAQTQASNQQNVAQNAGILRAQESASAGTNLANMYASQRQSAGAADQLQASVADSQQDRLLKGAGMGLAAMGLADGGMVDSDDHGNLLKLSGGDKDGGGMGIAALAAMFASDGAEVPGKAAVKGDSPKNDTIPAVLSPKEIVLPRSVTMAKDAPDKAKEFVEQILKRKGDQDAKADRPKSYGDVLAKHRKLEARVKELEAQLKDK